MSESKAEQTHSFDEPIPGESLAHFAVFREFLSFGPERGIRAFSRETGRQAEALYKLSAKHRWTSRAGQFRREIAGRRVKAAEEVATRDAEAHAAKWVQRKDTVREKEWSAHEELLKAAAEALRRWNESDKVPTLADVAKLLEMASKLGRLATGMATDHQAISSDAANPIRIEISAALQRVYGTDKPQPKALDVETVAQTP